MYDMRAQDSHEALADVAASGAPLWRDEGEKNVTELVHKNDGGPFVRSTALFTLPISYAAFPPPYSS